MAAVAEDPDVLVRDALELVVELFPISKFHLTYYDEDESPDLKEERTLSTLHQEYREVPGNTGRYRYVDLHLDKRLANFLGDDARLELGDDSRSLAIPIDLAHHWSEELQSSGNPEIHEVMRSKLPTYVVAHLMADRLAANCQNDDYRFSISDKTTPHDELTATIVRTLQYFDHLASSQVEGKQLSHGVLISEAETPSTTDVSYPEGFQNQERTPLIANGFDALLQIGPGGQPISLLSEDTLPEGETAHKYGNLSFAASASRQYEGLAMVLRPSGSIVTFIDGKPLFMRRSGSWSGLMWEGVKEVLTSRYGEVGRKVFDAVLNLATSECGCILSIVDEPLSLIAKKDRVDLAREEGSLDIGTMPPEWYFHRALPSDTLADISVGALSTLASIDGATIVSTDGKLLSYGAIIPNDKPQSEGARSAAARVLSKFGFALKVSEDGPVEVFVDEELFLRV